MEEEVTLDINMIPTEPDFDSSDMKLESPDEIPAEFMDEDFSVEDGEYKSGAALEPVSGASVILEEDASRSIMTLDPMTNVDLSEASLAFDGESSADALDSLLATSGLELPHEMNENIGDLISELAGICGDDSLDADKVDFSQLEVIPEEVSDVGAVRIMTAEEFAQSGLAAAYTEIPVAQQDDALQSAVNEIFSTIDETTWAEIAQPTSIQSTVSFASTEGTISECSSPEVAEKKPRKKSGRRKSDMNSEARKQRKREQNKEAAVRYRNRRKETQAANEEIMKALLKKNKVLKQRTKEIMREVSSITKLAREVFKK
jgi:hypothetical protein